VAALVASLNPWRSFLRPLAAGIVLGIIGAALAMPLLAALGGAVLVVLSVRVAYDHRGVGSRYAPPMGSAGSGLMPLWWRCQMTGGALFFLAVALVLASLRRLLPGS
jgi:hypothetical protein